MINSCCVYCVAQTYLMEQKCNISFSKMLILLIFSPFSCKCLCVMFYPQTQSHHTVYYLFNQCFTLFLFPSANIITIQTLCSSPCSFQCLLVFNHPGMRVESAICPLTTDLSLFYLPSPPSIYPFLFLLLSLKHFNQQILQSCMCLSVHSFCH